MKCKALKAFASDVAAPAVGEILDVPPEYVADWVKCGFAEALEVFPEPTVPAIETAAIEGAPETAVGKRQRK